MIAFASAVTYMLTIDLFPQQLAAFLKGITRDPLVFNLLVALVLLVVGCFLEINAAYIMLVPLLHPIALEYGLDPLHFGFLFVLNLVIGMLTPPVGVVLFVRVRHRQDQRRRDLPPHLAVRRGDVRAAAGVHVLPRPGAVAAAHGGVLNAAVTPRRGR